MASAMTYPGSVPGGLVDEDLGAHLQLGVVVQVEMLGLVDAVGGHRTMPPER
jgi:hypothetical protein